METNKIYHGDCIQLMSEMDDKSVEMILTDIPYVKVDKKSNGLRKLDKGEANFKTFNLQKFTNECIRLINGSIYIFCEWEQVSPLVKIFRNNKLSTRLHVWKKTNPSPLNCKYIWLSDIECCVYGKKPRATFNGHYESCVHEFKAGSSKIHPTQKNLDLFKKFVEISSNEGDLIFDPCIGSGTTAVAAKELSRNYIGIDINKKYVDLCIKRLNE